MPRRRKPVWRAYATGALIALIVALGTYLVLDNYVFVIRAVDVRGDASIPAEEVVRLSQIPVGKKMGALDTQKVKRAIDASGTLALVSVEGRYPSTVVLTVRRRSRDAFVVYGGKALIMDAEGYVVEQFAEMPDESMIYITGLNIASYTVGQQVNASGKALAAVHDALAAIAEVEAHAYISELNVADSKNLYLYSRTGIHVVLGDSSNMGAKLAWMKEALADLERRGETSGRLDVSSGTKADFRPQ